MDVYLVDPADVSAGTLTVRGDEAHHMLRVARHAEGDRVQVSDAAGCMYLVRILSATRDAAACEIIETHRGWNESPDRITVAAAMLRNPGRMDWLIEKCTELGTAGVQPLVTERTVARAAKTARWRQLALAATKQCGRSCVPRIDEPIALAELPLRAGDAQLLVCHESAAPHETIAALRATLADPCSVVVAIGPEGGFSDAEIALLSAAGARIVSLGARRLRAETAAVTALARLVT